MIAANKKLEAGIELPVMEIFYTIQGEGFHQGKPAYFIRIGGCDIGCHWCDVKDSWPAANHPKVKVRDLVTKASEAATDLVVVTGGEPLLYDLHLLTQGLKALYLKTHVETSGAYKLTGDWDWICLSPKKVKPPTKEIYPHANELKIIIYNHDDFKWAEEHAAQVNRECHLFLQPEWSKIDRMLPHIIDYVKQNPKWRISLQAHKYMNIP